VSATRLALLALAVAVAVAAVTLLPGHDPRPVTEPARTAAAARPADVPVVALLRRWDERRAEAYASGSLRRLADLYVARSGVGAADLRVLRSYRARGWRVVGMRMQLLAVRVLEHRARRLVVEVTDRLDGGVAVRRGHRLVLPRDESSSWRITLVRAADGRWRVAAVATLS
jgi:hypothetical protein